MDNTWVTVILASFVSLCLLYRYLMRHNNFWQKRGVPSIPAFPMLGSVPGLLFKVVHHWNLESYIKYGRLYGYYEFTKPVLVVGDLKLVREVLVKDFQTFPGLRDFVNNDDPIASNMLFFISGEKWKRLRMIMSPVFASGRIKKMFSIVLNSAEATAKNFLDASKKKEPVDSKKYCGAFTMDVIASAAFGTKIDSHNDPTNAFVKNALKVFGSMWRAFITVLMPIVSRTFSISLFDPSACNFFKQVTQQIIEERRRTGIKRNDFLQLLMDAEYTDEADGTAMKNTDEDNKSDDVSTDTKHVLNPTEKTKNFHNKKLNHDELISCCVMFFLAGYDTTSSTIAFVIYHLALNPEWQERVIQEIDDALRESKDGLTYDAIMQMKCLDMVVNETLRILPPAIRAERLSASDVKLGDIFLPKGTIVEIPIYSIHHDPEYHTDPEKFDPNRFSDEEKAKRDPYTFIPFGGGPRSCIASRFALIEVKTCLASVLSKVRFKHSPVTNMPLEFIKGQGFIGVKRVMIEVEERTDSVNYEE